VPHDHRLRPGDDRGLMFPGCVMLSSLAMLPGSGIVTMCRVHTVFCAFVVSHIVASFS
jgi:hypothetical protein